MGIWIAGKIRCHITCDHEDFMAAIEEILCDLVVDFTLTSLGGELVGDYTDVHDFPGNIVPNVSDSLVQLPEKEHPAP